MSGFFLAPGVFCDPVSRVFSLVFLPMLSATYPALPVASAIICIGIVVRVALGAMRLSRAFCRNTFAAKVIDSHGYGFKMRRVNATPDAAKVVNRKPLRYGTAKMIIRESVGVSCLGVDSKRPISVFFESPRPKPTGRSFFDKCKEAFNGVPLISENYFSVAARVGCLHV